MANQHVSGRALATALGVSEKAVRKAALAGRIPRADAGFYDLDACREAWGRSTDPARSKVRTSAPQDPQSGAVRSGPHPPVRTRRSAPLPDADAPALWAVLTYLVDLIPWAVAEHGGGLQLAYDTWSDVMLDLPAELNRRGFAGPADSFGTVDWDAVAETYGLPPVGPHVLAADYARRRAEG